MANNINSNTAPGPQNPAVETATIQSTWIQPKQLSQGDGAGVIMGQGPGDLIQFFSTWPTPGTQAPIPQILQGSLAGTNGVLKVYTTSQSPATVTANTTSEVSMTVTGVAATDMVVAIIKPTTQAGLAVGTARTSTTNTIAATFGNLTSSSITPTTTESYVVVTASAALQFPAVVLSPASVAAATTVEQIFTVPGVEPGMVVSVNKPTLQAGLLVNGARVVGVNQVAIEFMNVTTATVITPTASESYSFFAARGLRLQPVMQRITVNLTPANIAANTTAEQTFTVTGLQASTAINVDIPYNVEGVAMTGFRVSAANTLALAFGNTTAGSLPPPAGNYVISWYPEAVPAAGSATTFQATQGIDAGHALAAYGLLSPDVLIGV